MRWSFRSLPTTLLLFIALLSSPCPGNAFESDDDEFVGGPGSFKEGTGLDGVGVSQEGRVGQGANGKSSQLRLATSIESPVVNFTRYIHPISLILPLFMPLPLPLHLYRVPPSHLPGPVGHQCTVGHCFSLHGSLCGPNCGIDGSPAPAECWGLSPQLCNVRLFH